MSALKPLRRFFVCLVVLSMAFVMGCGVKGDPVPYIDTVPEKPPVETKP